MIKSIDLKNVDDENERKSVSESFGLMLRENIFKTPQTDVTPMVAAALFGNRQMGCELAHAQIPSWMRKEWFAAYVEQLTFPILYCFFEHAYYVDVQP